MEKMLETFNPVYNDAEQVIRCAQAMISEPVEKAEITLFIGHNGKDFVSSTDWLLTMQSGRKRILTTSVRPQYPNFVEIMSGAAYSVDERGFFEIKADPVGAEKKAVILLPDGTRKEIKPWKPLRITIPPKSNFIATDCHVICHEYNKERVYEVCIDQDTLYGYVDDKQHISSL